MEFLCLSKDTLVDWSLLPQVELVSDSEDDTEVATAKEEEAKAEWWRQKEAEEVRKAEEARRQEEEYRAEMEPKRQRAIDEAWEQMEREQQEEMQARAWAVTVTQGGGMPGPSTVVVVPMLRACERCMVLLQEPEGCVVSERGKARACLPCQKARKACVWPLGAGGVGAATGSRTKASGKPAPRQVRKRAERTAMNVSPRGGEKHKKARTTTEEGEDDDDTEEVFGVPRVMAEEQCDVLGMLTQALAQVVERMAAVEVRDEERLALEQETVEIWRAHLAMARRAADRKEERLEMDRVQLSITQQWTEDLWKMGTLMRSPFVYSSKEKERAVETEAEERGEEADDEDEDAQGEEE
ncbi:hypothetical protein SCLCIDRAFT_20593 [Scleroderma citrinum Foug A]|uniref:Uncharacterized protein n=1 Tax=Scleroderma citrinum Foug A TaxID=1036808 RepID=A0A0C3A3H0_9AGAM|nr:hypothetical protein SCLCIDRAFT_20593 [Scleroderma citrinum Foug A]